MLCFDKSRRPVCKSDAILMLSIGSPVLFELAAHVSLPIQSLSVQLRNSINLFQTEVQNTLVPSDVRQNTRPRYCLCAHTGGGQTCLAAPPCITPRHCPISSAASHNWKHFWFFFFFWLLVFVRLFFGAAKWTGVPLPVCAGAARHLIRTPLFCQDVLLLFEICVTSK